MDKVLELQQAILSHTETVKRLKEKAKEDREAVDKLKREFSRLLRKSRLLTSKANKSAVAAVKYERESRHALEKLVKGQMLTHADKLTLKLERELGNATQKPDSIKRPSRNGSIRGGIDSATETQP